MTPQEKLVLKDLTIGYPGNLLISKLNLTARSGELVCLMGPNGVGKSTLLRAIATLQAPLGGDILVDNQPIYQLGVKERARMISLVLTERLALGYLSVKELISMGRYPHTGWSGQLQDSDIKAVEGALKTTGLTDLAHRAARELSDGQLQKVFIARALSQDGGLMILDEPLIHLDISNKWEIMNLLRRTARKHEKTLIMATHEMGLSLKLSDKIWLMAPGGNLLHGSPEDLILNGSFKEVFDAPDFQFDVEIGDFVVNPAFQNLPVVGERTLKHWTCRALERAFTGDRNFPAACKITIKRHQEKPVWHLETSNNSIPCYSIEMLLDQLNYA